MTKSISRFGRDTVEGVSTLRELNHLGINVIFENDNIDTAQEDSELVITIISAVAQADNESCRKNIQWGRPSALKMEPPVSIAGAVMDMSMMKMENWRSNPMRLRSSAMYMRPIARGDVSTRSPGN